MSPENLVAIEKGLKEEIQNIFSTTAHKVITISLSPIENDFNLINAILLIEPDMERLWFEPPFKFQNQVLNLEEKQHVDLSRVIESVKGLLDRYTINQTIVINNGQQIALKIQARTTKFVINNLINIL